MIAGLVAKCLAKNRVCEPDKALKVDDGWRICSVQDVKAVLQHGPAVSHHTFLSCQPP